MFISFWLEKPKMGLKKILLVFLLVCTTIFLSKFTFIIILGLTVLFFSYCIRKYGYNILINEFSINGQNQRVVDSINPWIHKHIRTITNDFGVLSAIDINNPENNLYLSGIEKIIESKRSNLTFLHIGGGACSTPILLNHLHPESSHKVLEIDSEMIFVAKKFFIPFSINKKIVQTKTDAKKYTFKKNEKYDYIVQDLFTQKTDNSNFFLTKKWVKKIITHLANDGKLIINTSSKSQDVALNLALELKNIKEKIQIVNLKKTNLVVINNE